MNATGEAHETNTVDADGPGPGRRRRLGAALAYYVVMPTAFKFFLTFEGEKGGLQMEALPGTSDYLGLVMQFILAFGISFLMPVLLLLLNRAGIVTRAQLSAARRYVIVGIAIVAAIICVVLPRALPG